MERKEKERQAFLERINQIDSETVVYVDEMGVDNFLYRIYARAPRGQKVAGRISGKKFRRTNIVAGKCGSKIFAPLQYQGSTDSLLFEYWFENLFLKEIPTGFSIVMDNATFHRKAVLSKMAARTGCTLIFLPPYSPDLNPIEFFWAWIKRKLSDSLPSSSSFDTALSDCFQVL